MKTIEEIYSEMLGIFSQQTGLEPGSGGDLAVRFYAVAAQIHALYLQAAWTEKQCFPQTATGEHLDYHAALRGIQRKEAGAASGTLRFSVSAEAKSALTIPIGTVCMTSGLVRFETTQEAQLPVGALYVDVPAVALEKGAVGNVASGTIVTMAVAPAGIEACINPEAFTGGADNESDESLRTRVLETYRRLANGANAAFYQQQAMSFDGVVAASVNPRARGIGTVDVTIATKKGVPEQDLLNEVQRYFEQIREIAVDVKVLSPKKKAVTVAVSIKMAENCDKETVRQEVESVVASYFNGERLGKSVLLAELGAAVFSVDGVENYTFSLPSQDVEIQNDTLAVLDSLTVEEMD